MDTRFAKVVTDLDGRDHILIEGRIVSLVGNTDENNAMVDVIVRGLRGADMTWNEVRDSKVENGITFAVEQADLSGMSGVVPRAG